MKYTTLSELNILRNITLENVENVENTLNSNLEKGLISEELHKKALIQPENLIEKAGGIGSRGGKIIGHTRSGKPIYDSHSHESHKLFTKEDHKEAGKLHRKIADSYNSKSERAYDNGYEQAYEKHSRNAEKSLEESKKHEESAKNK